MTVSAGSSRSIYKATLVPLIADVPTQGQALLKASYVRQLALQPGEVDAVRRSLGASGNGSLESKQFADTSPLWDLLASFESSSMPTTLPPASVFPSIPASTFSTFGKALAVVRKQALDQLAPKLLLPGSSNTLVPNAKGLAVASPVRSLELEVGHLLFAAAAAANRGFDLNSTTSRIGMFNLERLEMTPAGIDPWRLERRRPWCTRSGR